MTQPWTISKDVTERRRMNEEQKRVNEHELREEVRWLYQKFSSCAAKDYSLGTGNVLVLDLRTRVRPSIPARSLEKTTLSYLRLELDPSSNS